MTHISSPRCGAFWGRFFGATGQGRPPSSPSPPLGERVWVRGEEAPTAGTLTPALSLPGRGKPRQSSPPPQPSPIEGEGERGPWGEGSSVALQAFAQMWVKRSPEGEGIGFATASQNGDAHPKTPCVERHATFTAKSGYAIQHQISGITERQPLAPWSLTSPAAIHRIPPRSVPAWPSRASI
jgi:hypothetical protein